MNVHGRKVWLTIAVALVAAGVVLVVALTRTRPVAADAPNGAGGPVWSPDGHDLVFMSATPNAPVNLWAASWHGEPGEVRRVTTGGGHFVGWASGVAGLLYRTTRGGGSALQIASLGTEPDRPVLAWLPPAAVAVAVSPNNKLVAYTLRGEGKRDLWLGDFEGGHPRRLTNKMNVRTPAWRPDGTQLAFDIGGAYGEATFVVNVTGEKPRLVFGGIGSYPSWSPNGKWLALIGLHSVTIVSADGRANHRLHFGVNDRGPLSWSPDSTRIVYSETKGATQGLGIAEADTGKTQALTQDWVRAAGAQWSPDGRRIAFEGMKPGEVVANVHVLDLDSGHDWALTSSFPSTWGARISGDGAVQFFLSNRDGDGVISLHRQDLKSGRDEALLRVDPSVSPQVHWPAGSSAGVLVQGAVIWRLSGQDAATKLLSTEHPTAADLSPRGDRLVYVKWHLHRSSLVVRQLSDGTEKEILAPPAGNMAYSKLAWSPGGDDIAFVRGDALCRLRLSDGAVSELMRAGAGGALLAPVWSPRGDALAVGDFEATPGSKLAIWTVRPGDQHRVLVAEAAVTAEPGWMAEPLTQPYAWSPGGRLACCLEKDGAPALYLADLAAEPVTPALLRAAAAYPEWSGDQEIIYTDLAGNREQLARLKAPAPAFSFQGGGRR